MSDVLTLKQVVDRVTRSRIRALPPASFVRVHARRLRHARVVWVNWPLLHELGVARSCARLTPDVERVLLNAFAYRIQQESDDERDFVGNARVFLADRYGGDGVPPNTGSGRAAAVGLMQLKGIGTTPLVDPSTPYDHRHGSLYLGDAVREAIWGELNHLESPHGSSRVLLIIDVGSSFALPGGRLRRRSLLVRPLPLRPAHFLPNLHTPVTRRQFQQLQLYLASALPSADEAGAAPTAARLRDGFGELAERVGRQHATLLACRAPHGAMSSSNIELSGKLLDMETQSAQPGHGPTLAIRGSMYRSDCTSSLEKMLRGLQFAARLGLPEKLSRAVPDYEELATQLTRAHHDTLLNRLLALCGFPDFTLQAATPAYVALATCIRDAALDQGEPIVIERGVPRWTGRYDVGSLLFCLACLHRRGLPGAKRVLLNGRAGVELNALCDAYFAFRDEVERNAEARGVSAAELEPLIARLCSVRNEKRPSLYLPQLQKRNALVLRGYLTTGDPASLRAHIDQLICANRRFFGDSAQLCVVREWRHRDSGASVRYAYAPGQGYLLDVTAVVESQTLRFFDEQQAIPRGAAPRASLRLGTNMGRTSQLTFEMAERDDTFRLVARLEPQVVRFGVRVGAQNNGAAHRRFDALPRSYHEGVRQFERGAMLRRAVAAPA